MGTENLTTVVRLDEVLAQRERAHSAFREAASNGFAADHGWVDPALSWALDQAAEVENTRYKELLDALRRDARDVFDAWAGGELAAAEREGNEHQAARWRLVLREGLDDVILNNL